MLTALCVVVNFPKVPGYLFIFMLITTMLCFVEFSQQNFGACSIIIPISEMWKQAERSEIHPQIQ
jgi:hypothetical protein